MLQPNMRFVAVNNTDILMHGEINIPVKTDDSEWLHITFYMCDTTSLAILSCDATERLGIVIVRKSPNISIIQ